MAENAYKQHFRGMMAKEGYQHPGQIPAEKKKDFFKKVDRSWKAKDEGAQSMSRAQQIIERLESFLASTEPQVQEGVAAKAVTVGAAAGGLGYVASKALKGGAKVVHAIETHRNQYMPKE